MDRNFRTSDESDNNESNIFENKKKWLDQKKEKKIIDKIRIISLA